ncbi:MAG TPA: 23S rRNA (uracil(1939)-C(5))-methyltransferase RlmD [Syntrophomonadaceae bacterium]|nr:23S rRNA (uracil(1939)-C(5))-methyltransferase RlmD [Syntrophomonadaceae bacterium]
MNGWVKQLREKKAVIDSPITTIQGYSHAGEGVGRFQGKPVFIPLAARGETVRFAITEEKKDFARGKLLEIVEPASWRTTPQCNTYQNCGGCHLLHLNYEEQLYFKQQRVISALRRIGRLDNVAINPILRMDNPWHYRHTARFHINKTEYSLEIGYYRLKSHTLEQIKDCPLLPDDFFRLRNAIAEFLGSLKGSFRIPARQVVLRKGRATGDLLVRLLADDFPVETDRESISALAAEFPNLRGIVISLINRPEAPEMILFGHNYYTEIISETKFRIPAGAFFQNNPAQTEVLLRTVSTFSEPQPHETLIDLYCGVGLFAHSLAPMVKRVYGIEENKTAVAAAVENADINGTGNTVFIRGEVENALPLLAKQGITADTVILDPPRQGSTPQALREICNMSPNRIVYVSCDPATLARDLALLAKRGYETIVVQPVDMFPHTYHVECIALIKRDNPT